MIRAKGFAGACISRCIERKTIVIQRGNSNSAVIALDYHTIGYTYNLLPEYRAYLSMAVMHTTKSIPGGRDALFGY